VLVAQVFHLAPPVALVIEVVVHRAPLKRLIHVITLTAAEAVSTMIQNVTTPTNVASAEPKVMLVLHVK
jgi:hypothetical protein